MDLRRPSRLPAKLGRGMIRSMTVAVQTPSAGIAGRGPEHIVDVLIKERAPRLAASAVWPVARPLLYALLGYQPARAMADRVSAVGGAEAMGYVSGLLQLRTEARGLERVPAKGRMVVVVNHPTGLADGVAVDDALRPLRPDLIYFANADALRVNPRLGEVFIPVEWVEAKRTLQKTRLTVKQAQEALETERALVIFPAGRISRLRGGVLADPVWQASALSLARRHRALVLPIHLKGPPSMLFRLFDHLSPELRDITLFHELLNKRRGAFQVTVGPPIPPEAIHDPADDIQRLKRYVEVVLPADPDRPFA
jgi:putative hemolysin